MDAIAHTPTPDAGPTTPRADAADAMNWVETAARRQRAVLTLVLHGGFTCDDAAATLGLTPTTVSGLATAGLRELAE